MASIEPVPTGIRFPPRESWGPDDLVAVGGSFLPGTILAAYRQGLFPMPLDDGRLGWWSPVDRAVIEFANLKISRSLQRSCRRYTVSIDTDMEGVIEGCADPSRPDGWITNEVKTAYIDLYRLGWVHSFEVWDQDGDLAGGLYGVAIGGLFCGESMFHVATDASKVALVHLVSFLSEGGAELLDVQWKTDHLASLGATVIGRDRYLERLPAALARPNPFDFQD